MGLTAFFLAALVFPAWALDKKRKNQRALEDYLRKHDYELKNPVFRRRWNRAAWVGLAAYYVVALFLTLMFHVGWRTTVFEAFMIAGVCNAFGFPAFTIVRIVALAVQEWGKMDAGIVLDERDKAWVKRPQPIEPDKEHGGTKLGQAADTELAETQEGGAR